MVVKFKEEPTSRRTCVPEDSSESRFAIRESNSLSGMGKFLPAVFHKLRLQEELITVIHVLVIS